MTTATNKNTKHAMFLGRVSSSGMSFVPETNTQMWSIPRLYYKGFTGSRVPLRFDGKGESRSSCQACSLSKDRNSLHSCDCSDSLVTRAPERSRKRIPHLKWARESRVSTFASLIPRTCAVSAMLSCWPPRSITTVRYFSGSEFKADASASRGSFRSKASDGISRQSKKSLGM